MSEVPYRLPEPPQDISHPYGGATALAAAGAGVALWAATEYVAWGFGWQARLGAPVWGYIYHPLALAKWTVQFWRYGGQIREILQIGWIIAGAGAFVAITGWNMRCSAIRRRMRDGMDNLHGSARLATDKDVRETGLLNSPGVTLCRWGNGVLRHNGPEHVLVEAPTRTGKGVSVVIPTLLEWPGSVLVYDIKGENWHYTSGFRAQHTACLRFAPAEAESNRYNPLDEIRLNSLHDVDDAVKIAVSLLKEGINASDPHWHITAGELLAAIILHVCYTSHLAGTQACMADVNAFVKRPGVPFDVSLQEIMRAPHFASGESSKAIARKIQIQLTRGPNEAGSVYSTATTGLQLFDSPLVARHTSSSDFSAMDLMNAERPVSLYIVVPPGEEGDYLRPLMRVVLTQIVDRLTRKMSFEEQPYKHRLLFLVDEFPSLMRLNIFAKGLDYMAGYGIKCLLIAQSHLQIRNVYGNNESITANCAVRVAFTPNTVEACKYVSEACGVMTVAAPHVSYSGTKQNSPKNASAHITPTSRPVLYPDEVGRLRTPTTVTAGDKQRITAPGQALVFYGGHYPILADQRLYFMEPELLRRSLVQPPDMFVAIEEGVETEQLPPRYDLSEITIAPLAERIPETAQIDEDNDKLPKVAISHINDWV